MKTRRKWELCFMEKSQQEQWYDALKRFNGKHDELKNSNNSIQFNNISPKPVQPLKTYIKIKLDSPFLLSSAPDNKKPKCQIRRRYTKGKYSNYDDKPSDIGALFDYLISNDYFIFFS